LMPATVIELMCAGEASAILTVGPARGRTRDIGGPMRKAVAESENHSSADAMVS
jgi:hypothetical protein